MFYHIRVFRRRLISLGFFPVAWGEVAQGQQPAGENDLGSEDNRGSAGTAGTTADRNQWRRLRGSRMPRVSVH